MTATAVPPQSTEPTAAAQVAVLREWLADEAHRANWPDIEKAIVYLTATNILGA